MNTKRIPFGTILLLLLALLFTACNSSAVDEEPMTMEDGEMDHDAMDDSDMAHMDGEDDHMAGRIPNEGGATISIISPANGDIFAANEQVIVEVEVENFELGGNNHWHVYIDGSSWGMVMGNNTDQPLTGLEPGEHEIAVYLSIESHEEYEDGDAVTITIEE